MTWIAVAPVSSIAPGDFVQVEVDDVFVAVFNVAGAFHAIQDVCTHDGEGLTGGVVEDDVIVCPRHGARFCLRNGAVLSPPAYEPLRTFPTRVVDGMVEVEAEDS